MNAAVNSSATVNAGEEQHFESFESTKRPRVKLPPPVTVGEALVRYPAIEMVRSHFEGDRLVFDQADGMNQAIRQGFFLVRIPEGVDPRGGDAFASHFHEEPRGNGDPLDVYRGFRGRKVPGDYQGYFDRDHDQWENFYIEQGNWNGVLPPDVVTLGHQMTDLGIAVLKNVLAHLDIPSSEWDLVTSGLTRKQGHQMLAFNHFRADKPTRGTKFHRDSGWVTVLRSVEPGLLAWIDGKLFRVDPSPGYFIANFGSSIEVLTSRFNRPVRANIHGVARTEPRPGMPNRMSYVVFLDSNLGGQIYRYDGKTPKAIQSVAEFAVQEVSRTYDDDSETL